MPIPPKRPFPLITRWLVGTAVFLFSLLASWLLLNNRATQTEARLQASVQAILDLEYQAYRRGDGAHFFYGHERRSGLAGGAPAAAKSGRHPRQSGGNGRASAGERAVGDYCLGRGGTNVAARTAYWANLSRPLNEALRAAFPFARPVTLADQLYFSWEQITAVTTHQLTPRQAAQEIPALIWFTAP